MGVAKCAFLFLARLWLSLLFVFFPPHLVSIALVRSSRLVFPFHFALLFGGRGWFCGWNASPFGLDLRQCSNILLDASSFSSYRVHCLGRTAIVIVSDQGSSPRAKGHRLGRTASFDLNGLPDWPHWLDGCLAVYFPAYKLTFLFTFGELNVRAFLSLFGCSSEALNSNEARSLNSRRALLCMILRAHVMCSKSRSRSITPRACAPCHIARTLASH